MAATVSISIVGRTYEISCDEGQEEYVRALAAEVDHRAGNLLRSVGQVGDARLLVMVCLLMADELSEMRRSRPGGRTPDEAADGALAGGIEALTRRVDAIAERLEKT
jgi:cell division protein ZapA